MQNDVTVNGGQYSQLFWIKPTENFLALEPTGKNHPDILFFQSISPPVLLSHLRLYVENGALRAQNYMYSGMCGDSVDSEETTVTIGADWRGRWMQITMVFGATTSTVRECASWLILQVQMTALTGSGVHLKTLSILK